MIYFMQPTTGCAIKIGHTENLPNRHRQLEKHYGTALAILATMEGGREQEQEIHRQFGHLRITGNGSRGGQPEQFRPAAELMAFIGRPLLVDPNPDAVEAIDAIGHTTSVIHMKGSPAYVAWLEKIHKATHIPKVQIFRVAIREWAKRNKHPEPPEI